VPPSLETDDDNPSFVTVSREDCELSGDREEVFEKLKQDLIAQIRVSIVRRWKTTVIHILGSFL